MRKEEEKVMSDKRLLTSLNEAFTDGPPVQLSLDMIRLWTNDFEDEKRIGRGGFGDVYAGLIFVETERSGSSQELLPAERRRVAVKKINASSLALAASGVDGDRTRLERNMLQSAQREINVLASFRQCPNLIRLIGYSMPEDRQQLSEVCLVYEYAGLGDLLRFLREKGEKLRFQDRIRVMFGIARGLNYLHCSDREHPAFHRDIKSSNIVLMKDLVPMLIDCGLAKYSPSFERGGGTTVFSTVGARLGTPAYMCKQYMGAVEMEFDAKCDIYSFGIVLCEVLTGEGQGVINEDGDLRFELDTVDDLTPDPRAGEWPAECVQSLLGIIKRCLAKRAKRFASMSEVLQQLRNIKERFCTRSEREEELIRENKALQDEIARSHDERELKERIAETEEKRECPCCIAEYKLSEGIVCANDAVRHFLCSDCFTHQVKATCNDLSLFMRNGCAIVCCFCQAQRPPFIARFDDHLVSKVCSHTDVDAMRAFLEVRERAARELADAISEARIAQIREEEQEKRLQVEARLLSDEREKRQRTIEFHRQRIINRILTARCPHCDGAFLDWKNCDAVMHGPSEVGDPDFGCKRYFCPWCLGKCDSNDDAHQHIRENRCGRVHKEEEFERVQASTRARRIIEYIEANITTSEGGAQLREDVVNAMRQSDLAPIGIHL